MASSVVCACLQAVVVEIVDVEVMVQNRAR